jgi:serine protease SohB
VEFLANYGLFLAKMVTIAVAIVLVLSAVVGLAMREKSTKHGHIEINKLNDDLEDMKHVLQSAVLDKDELKAAEKAEKKIKKETDKKQKKDAKKKDGELIERKKRVYVLDFDGDIRASEVSSLKEEITTVLTLAEPQDEVVLRLESGGGMVHSYGLASSQLERITRQQIPLTVCVDKVAASGGYMMACIANKIVAAPFAILGSIGVIGQAPNFNRLLKKHDIDYEMHTAGDYKRTLTLLGENTDKGRQKFIEELEDTHDLFKLFVKEFRPIVDIEKVATGEVWFGKRALDVKLVDELNTSDDYLVQSAKLCDVYEVKFVDKKSLPERLGLAASIALDKTLVNWVTKISNSRFFS